MPKRNRFFGTRLASRQASSSYKIGCVVEDIAISRLDLYTAENGLHFQALGAVYIFDRYGVINNGFFAKKKKRGRKEKKRKWEDSRYTFFFL